MNVKGVIRLSTILIAMTLAWTACAGTPSLTTGPATGATVASTAVQGSEVSIENFKFNPETTTVKAGTTVTWTNNDTAAHDIKSDSFHSPSLAKGQTFAFLFGTKGTFEYACGVHPSMKGTVIVE